MSGGLDGSLLLWDTHQRKALSNGFDGGFGQVLHATVNPQLDWVVAASRIGAAMLWDYHSGRPVQPLDDLALKNSLHVEFSPDGRWLAVTGSAREANQVAPVVLWQLDLAGWQAMACRKVSRDLSAEEWQQFVGAIPQVRLCPDRS